MIEKSVVAVCDLCGTSTSHIEGYQPYVWIMQQGWTTKTVDEGTLMFCPKHPDGKTD